MRSQYCLPLRYRTWAKCHWDDILSCGHFLDKCNSGKNKLDINFTLVYNTSFLYVLQFQKRIMCIFWWHKFGLFVPSFMGWAIDKNVITIMGIHDYIYSSLVINGLNRHLDRYVVSDSSETSPGKNCCYTLMGQKDTFPVQLNHVNLTVRAVGSSNIINSLIIYRTTGLSEHRYPYNTFGISSLRNKHLRTKESSEYRTFEL